MTGLQFFNHYYAIPVLKTLWHNDPSSQTKEKDIRWNSPDDARHWFEIFPLLDKPQRSIEEDRLIAFNTLSGRMAHVFEKKEFLKDEHGKLAKDPVTQQSIWTGNWEDVERNHLVRDSADAWNHLIITSKGYYSYVRNKSPLKHLGHQVSALPRFTNSDTFQETGQIYQTETFQDASLYHLAQNWDGTPFLLLDLSDQPQVDLLRMTHDWRCAQYNRADHVSLDLSQLLTKETS